MNWRRELLKITLQKFYYYNCGHRRANEGYAGTDVATAGTDVTTTETDATSSGTDAEAK